MDAARRRALIKQQAAVKKKQEGNLPPKTGLSIQSAKRQPSEKVDCHSKKQKLVTGLVAVQGSGELKMPPKLGIGRGKGLMTNPDPVKERPPVLLREDSQYALHKVTSILTDEDYEDLGNHATEAMGETALYSLAQGVLMAKGLMDRCLTQEKTLDCVRAKSKATGEELDELKLWKHRHEEKLKLSEQARSDLEKEVELLKETLKAKEESLRQAKIEAIQEYRDSEALVSELATSFADGFDDCIRQVKALFPDFDLSHISIDGEGQTPTCPVNSEATEDLFGRDPNDGGVPDETTADNNAQQPSIHREVDEGNTVILE
ncbi:uncharacterized protein LOC142612399 [Castanea sativa]|uniref:uncharacterized protein LOC142612399 n=1 Tax=Castanea sativa TaxID=21020 RepID=UPI003F64A2A5